MPARLLNTLNLGYKHNVISVRRVWDEKPSILLMFERYFLLFSTCPPSGRFVSSFIAAPSVGTSEFGLVFISPSSVETSEPGLRPRPSSPVQSSLSLLFPMSCFCLSCWCLPCRCVLHVFCPCLGCFVLIVASLGCRPCLVAGPSRGFCLSLWSCPPLSLSLSLSCSLSCRCLGGCQSCINSLPLALVARVRRSGVPPNLSSLNVARVHLGTSWLVFLCGVGYDDSVAVQCLIGTPKVTTNKCTSQL